MPLLHWIDASCVMINGHTLIMEKAKNGGVLTFHLGLFLELSMDSKDKSNFFVGFHSQIKTHVFCSPIYWIAHHQKHFMLYVDIITL